MEEKNLNWRSLLEDYTKISDPNKKSPEIQEEETTKMFFDHMYYNENKQSNIPKFYYKKPINYNDLYFNVKTEAKNRFLSLKSYELPQKTRKIVYFTLNPLKINSYIFLSF